MITLPDEPQVLERLVQHIQKKTTDLDLSVSTHQWSSAIYTSDGFLKNEVQAFGNRLPHLLGPAHELLVKNHSYVTREVWNASWIVWRSQELGYKAYLNRCRHRGMKLVDSTTQSTEVRCSQHLVCPYHKWSYGEDGVCAFVPEQERAFPGLDVKQIRLHGREVVERQGLLWMLKNRDEDSLQLIDQISNQIPDLSACTYRSVQNYDVAANWKLIHESFLESYHVPYVHQKTLAPATISHMGINDYYGPHSRAVYPLKRLQSELSKRDPESSSVRAPLRKMVSVVYQLFPNAFLSLQPFHILLTRLCPTAVNRTRVEIYCFAELSDEAEFAPLIDKDIEFVRKGMLEDFDVAEKVQQTLGYSRPNDREVFMAGGFEGQIRHFHENLFTYCKDI